MPKKQKRHSALYSADEIAAMRCFAKEGKSARETAKIIGRTVGGLKFKAMSLGIHFHAVKQPRGVQKRLALKRAKYGQNATLRTP